MYEYIFISVILSWNGKTISDLLIVNDIIMAVCLNSELLEEDNSKRLLISVWNKEAGNR